VCVCISQQIVTLGIKFYYITSR